MKIDIIYYKLGQKYGFENIAFRKELKTVYDTKQEENGSFTISKKIGEYFGSIYFINTKNNTKIDLQEEVKLGTFNKEGNNE